MLPSAELPPWQCGAPGMISRILHHLGPGKRRRLLLHRLHDTARQIRRRSDVLALTPAVHGSFWRGVNVATHALFPERVLEMPHALTVAVRDGPALDEAARGLAAAGFSQIILSGFPPSFERLTLQLRAAGVRVGCLYHAPLAACGLSPETAHSLRTILRLLRGGEIAKLACNAKGLPETIARLTGLEVCEFRLPTRVPPGSAERRPAGGLRIGVLGENTFRKNIHTQVAAALLVEGATVHVGGRPDLDYWGSTGRIVRHPAAMPHRDFVARLGEMDVNLHLSFSESWGQLTTESLAMGVPCLIANHSDVYDFDPELRSVLVSDHFNDPPSLARDIERVLALRDQLSPRCREYVSLLNVKAEESLQRFLAL